MSEANGVPASARVVVVGNEKGGSGKSTVAMHLAVALMQSGLRVATIDLDSRQKSLTAYIENRRTWADRVKRELPTPTHLCIDRDDDDADVGAGLIAAVAKLSDNHDIIVIDTPGHDTEANRQAHALAQTLVTPLNDSFVDFDLLASLDPETFEVEGISHYASLVEKARHERQLAGLPPMEWVVLRNRLSMLNTRNKRLVGDALERLSDRLNFRFVDGLAERMIFREFFPRGLTALDELNERTLGARPTLSHATARREVMALIAAMGLASEAAAPRSDATLARDAA